MENSPFNKLSKELRDNIYEYLLPDPRWIVDLSRGRVYQQVLITQLCQQMREEALCVWTKTYKLYIETPPDLLEENGCHIDLPSRFRILLERGAVNFQRLPVLFHSKPTTIELNVAVWTKQEIADDLRASHSAAWMRIRNSVQRFTKEIHPHKLTFRFFCRYITPILQEYELDSHDSVLKCDTLPQSARELEALLVKFEAAGGYQAARSALSEAVAKQEEEMEKHADHAICMVNMMNDMVMELIHETEEIINVFLEHIFEDTALVLDGTAREALYATR
jgi:hypothetical protein